jgi:hypothetical protein
MKRRLSLLYVLSTSLLAIASLIYVYAKPPPSMKLDKDGIAHLSSPVINPDTGESVDLRILVRHYKGD